MDEAIDMLVRMEDETKMVRSQRFFVATGRPLKCLVRRHLTYKIKLQKTYSARKWDSHQIKLHMPLGSR